MKRLYHTAISLIISLFIIASANATCDLIEIKKQSFGGLELIRSCSVIPITEILPGIPDICADLPVTEPQDLVVNLVTHDMMYFNWEIPPEKIEPLESALDLVDRGFKLAPIELIRGETPKHFMSLNFYSVLIAGEIAYRSEWSTYVTKDGDPTPRFMVVEALSSEDAADPTHPGFIKPGSDVNYLVSGDLIQANNDAFQAALTLPNSSNSKNTKRNAINTNRNSVNANRKSPNPVLVSSSWAVANDSLYYVNGLADAALFNGMLYDSPLISIDPTTAQINNESFWSAFIPDQPTHIVYFSEPLEFAFIPYFNLLDPSLGLDPGYVLALQLFKNTFFGFASYGHAFLVLQGDEEPLANFDVSTSTVPSAYINFNIPNENRKKFEAELGLPDGFKLAKSKMTADQREQYLLTLNIYESPDLLTGMSTFRAEWSVYVQNKNDPSTDGTYLMVIDVDSNSPSLNPVDLFTPPTPFDYSVENGTLTADINFLGGSDKFSFQLDISALDAPKVKLLDKWVLSNDRIYWLNGVYDILFYNGNLLGAEVIEVNPELITIDDQTPWAEYIDPTPTQVVFFDKPQNFIIHPWYNVEELCAAE